MQVKFRKIAASLTLFFMLFAGLAMIVKRPNEIETKPFQDLISKLNHRSIHQ